MLKHISKPLPLLLLFITLFSIAVVSISKKKQADQQLYLSKIQDSILQERKELYTRIKSPNITDSVGLKQGQWTAFFDEQWKTTDAIEKAAFYEIANFKNGKYEGRVFKFYISGVPYWEGEILSETPLVLNGSCVWYHPSGSVSRSATFKSGKFHGVEQIYHANDSLQFYREYNNGQLNGKVAEYQENGTLIYTKTYYKGKLQGTSKYFDDAGKLELVENYRQDILHGQRQQFDAQGGTIENANYRNGQLHGLKIVYYDNQKTKTKENYYKGKLSGQKVQYYANGQKAVIEYYSNGKRSGRFQEYYENGQKRQSGTYSKNNKVGSWAYYNEDGEYLKTRFVDVRVGAICRDGSRSYATGRGACSWHGGVSYWLVEPSEVQVAVSSGYK